MQKILTKYLLTIHLGLLLLSSWLFSFVPSFSAWVPTFWLSLLVAETVVLLPSVRHGETLADARSRVGQAVLRDPFFYLGVALILFVLVQWINGGCKLVYLPDADVWKYSNPTIPGAPFCIEPQAALTQTSVFLCGVVGCLALRHAFSQSGRRYFFRYAVAVSGVLAICLILRAFFGAEPYAGWMLGKSETVLGAFFGFWLMLSFGVLADALVRDDAWIQAVLGVVGNLSGVMFFAQTWTLLSILAMSAALVFYLLFFVHRQIARSSYWKLVVVSFAAVAVVGFVCVYSFQGNQLPSKIRGVFSWEQAWRTLSETKTVRTSAALKIWQDHPWVGVGADGFRHFVGTSVSEKEWHRIKVDQSSVYNDGLQFLCEYGLLGFGLFLFCVLTLAFSCFHRVSNFLKRDKSGSNDLVSPGLLRSSPVFVAGNLSIGMCACACWFSSLFTSPGLLVSWLLVLAALPAFLPVGAKR